MTNLSQGRLPSQKWNEHQLRRWGIAFCALSFWVGPWPVVKGADDPVLTAKQIYQAALKNSVLIVIRAPDGKELSRGSGWLLDKSRRLVITNHHVVTDRATAQVYFPEFKNGRPISEKDYYDKKAEAIPGEVFLSDPGLDLAVLRLDSIPESAIAATLADESPSPGDLLHSVGNPGSSDALWIYTTGTVRAVYKTKVMYDGGQRVHATVIETQSPINPGDSGGPVVDDQAHVVGVVSSYRTNSRLVSHFIDITEIKKFGTQVDELYAPKTVDHFLIRGEQFRTRRNFTKAIADFSAALKIDNKSALAMAHRGACFAEQGDNDTAEADFNEAIKIDSACAYAYRQRILLYAKTSRLDPLIADATQMARVSTDDSFPYLYRGLAHFDKREDSQAHADFTRAIKIQPTLTSAYFYRGQVSRRNGKPDPAVDDFISAVNLAPRDEQAVQFLTDTLLFDKKDGVQAVKVLTELLTLTPDNSFALAHRGRVYFAMDQVEMALQDMNAAVKLNPRHAVIYDVRGDVYLARRDYQAALNDYINAANLEPTNPLFHVDVGIALLKLDRHAESLKAFDNAIKKNPKLAPAYMRRAIAHFTLGNLEQSAADVRIAKELEPGFEELDVKRRMTKYLRITNATDEQLEVSVHYWTKNINGDFAWYPSPPGPAGTPAVFKIEPKRTVFLIHKNVRVHAEKVRIVAKGLKSGKSSDKYALEDLFLVTGNGYVAAEGENYDYTFSSP